MRFPAKITSSCISVAIPVDWVILHWYACVCGQTVFRTGGRSVYGHVITNFSRKGRSLHFLTYGAPLASFARESSAINWSNNCLKELCETLLNRANSSTYSQKAPAVAWFGLFYFTREEPGTVQKEIELWDSFKGPNRSHWLLQGWAGNWVKIRYPPPYLPPPPLNRPTVILDTVPTQFMSKKIFK